MKRSLLCYFASLAFSLFLSTEINAQTIDILSISKTNETCRANNDGTITISVTGGTKPYVYHIVHGVDSRNSVATNDTTYTFNGVWATSWIVFVEDDLNIADFGNIIVTEPAAISITSSTVTPITCTGFGDGKINVTAAGESGSYNFTLNPGPVGTTTGIFTGLVPDTYTVTVTDATGCTTSAITGPLTLSNPFPINVNSASATAITCNGLANGIINVSGSGGTGGFVYTLNPGAIATNGSGNFTGLISGIYTVNITDANACPSVNTAPLTINEPAIVTGSIISQTNVLCFGSSTGSVTVAGSGGTGAYTYNIDGGVFGASGTFNGLAAGAHPVQVKDANGCTTNVGVNITQPTALSGSISSQTNVLCFGLATGSVTVAGSGGTIAYTYRIDAGVFGASGTFNGLSAGAHTVQVRDANLCTFNVPVSITQPAAAVSGSITSQTNVLCFGSATGSVTVSGSGGTGAYTYNIDGGVFGASGTFGSLAAGVHPVQVKDANGCTATVNVTITQPASGVSGSITSQTNVLCFGTSTGSVTVAGANGTGPYTYNIDGGVFGASGTFSALAAGAHTVQVKDANGCTANVAVNITQPATAVSGSIISQTNVLCFGSSTGSVTVAGSGGTGAYTYNIDGGVFGASGTFNGLAAGAHPVQVKDTNGCTANVAVNITQPTALSGSISSQTNVLCFGLATGSVTVAGSGGTIAYSYRIDAGVFGASGTFNGLSAGAHTVQVRDANGCTFNVPVSITQPAAAVSGSITSQTNVLCFGSATGSVTVSGSGGTGAYTYNIDGGVFGASGTFGSLAAGVHPVQVKDANGCTATVNVTITQPASGVSGSITSQTNVLCFGTSTGSVTVAGANGTGPYTYNIDGGVFGASGTFSALAAGAHTVQVKDANGCTANVAVNITQPATAVSGSIISQTNVLCFGSSTGSVTVAGSGGTGAYTYNIDGGVFGASGTFNGLAAGAHPVQVKDANGCTANVAVNITQPTALSGSISSQTNVLCFGLATGSVTVAGSGGTIAYTYRIDAGVFGASGTFNGLSAGAHTVQVRDANLCTFNVPVSITQPAAAVSGSITSQTNVLCFGSATGSVTVSGSGGTGAYTYNIDGGVFGASGTFGALAADVHPVQVKDANGCTATVNVTITQPASGVSGSITSQTNVLCFGTSTGSVTVAGANGTGPYTYNIDGGVFGASGTFSALAAGAHTVQVKDANGCTADVAVLLAEPVVLSSLISNTDITCNGLNNGSVTITASGGTAPYTYSRTPFPYQASNIFINLTKNSYTFNTQDANGCISSNNATINEPLALSIPNEIKIDNNICFGDSLGEVRILLVSGGVTPYEYSINGGLNFYPGSIFQNLPAGNYQTQVRDANGCLKNGNLNNISQPARIYINNYTQSDVTNCFGNTDGMIAIEAVGGTGAITYDLDGLVNNPTGIFNSVNGGNHIITMTDTKACSIDTTVNLTEPVEIVFSGLAITDVTGCTGDSNGAINAVASGGAGSFNYSFNGGAYQAGGNFVGLTAGSYTLSARDANLCVKDTIINISEPAPVSILNQSSVNVSCASANDGSITITAAGGTAPYTYVLNPGAVVTNATGIFNLLSPGDYSVDVTDNSGCGPVSSIPVTITEPAGITRDSVISKEITCAGSDNGEIQIFVSGGTTPYTYSIDDGTNYGITGDFSGLTAGTYHLSVMDAMSCSLNLDTLSFIEPSAITMVSENKTDIVSCAGDPLGEVDFVASGGTGVIEYSLDLLTWQATGQFTGLTAGSYNVTARDQNLCTLSSSVLTITAPEPITADITTTPDINEFNKGSVSIINASGGTGTLVFSITGPAGVFSAQTDYPGLDAGTYPVVVKDDNNCTFEQEVVVSSIPALDVTVTLTSSTCKGDDDGTITMVCANGNPPLEYSIDDSITWVGSGIFTNLPPGTYNIFVRDSQSRYFQDTVQLIDPLDINIFGNITPSSCSSFSGDGAIDVTVNGGSSPYTYLWTSGEITQDLSNINAGSYHVTVTDSKLCNNEMNFDLPAVTTVIADAGPDTTICFGATYLLNGQGGTVMSWSPTDGLSNPNISNPVVTITTDAQYILTVVGFNDCVDIDTIDIIVRPEMDLNAGNDTTLVKDGEVTLVAEGGPFESYSWLPVTGLSTPDQPSTLAHPLVTSNYIITVGNEFGCTESDTVQVRIAEKLIVYDVFTPNGDTKNDYFDIENADLYPDILVEVFTRWGEKLFSSTGYNDDQRWDGTFKGKEVPLGTYYYVIVPYNGAEALTGPLTIVR